MDDAVYQARTKIAEIGRMLFDRRLTDSAGGNISMRLGDLVCITARYSGSRHHWQLHPEQVLVTDRSGKKLEGDGEISREAKVHYRLYQEFPDAAAVVHSHARNVMVFASAAQPIVPVIEATLKFGVIPVAPFSPAHSGQLAEGIVELARCQQEWIGKYATAVLAPWHGLFVVGRDIDAAFDLTERIDTNCYCILMNRLLAEGGQAAPAHAKLMDAIRLFDDRHS